MALTHAQCYMWECILKMFWDREISLADRLKIWFLTNRNQTGSFVRQLTEWDCQVPSAHWAKTYEKCTSLLSTFQSASWRLQPDFSISSSHFHCVLGALEPVYGWNNIENQYTSEIVIKSLDRLPFTFHWLIDAFITGSLTDRYGMEFTVLSLFESHE